MDKLRFMRLWDLYRNLLTETQREITDLYFNLDLTVSEIAEQKGITRQAASECLSVCRKQLAQYEQKLGLSRMMREGDLHESFMVSDIESWAKQFFSAHKEFSSDAENLYNILQNDYVDEINKALVKLKEV